MHQFNGVNPSALPRPLTLFSWNEIHTVENGEDVYTAMAMFPQMSMSLARCKRCPSAVSLLNQHLRPLFPESEYRSLCQSLKRTPPLRSILPPTIQKLLTPGWRSIPSLGKEAQRSQRIQPCRYGSGRNERVLFIISIFCYGFSITLMMLISVLGAQPSLPICSSAKGVCHARSP